MRVQPQSWKCRGIGYLEISIVFPRNWLSLLPCLIDSPVVFLFLFSLLDKVFCKPSGLELSI